MAPHLDQQLRERIVSWRFDDEKPAREIAALANCLEATVYNVLRLHRMFGTVTNPYRQQRSRPRALDQGDMNYIYSILEANPSLYIDEIQQKLFEVRDVDVSIATI